MGVEWCEMVAVGEVEKRKEYSGTFEVFSNWGKYFRLRGSISCWGKHFLLREAFPVGGSISCWGKHFLLRASIPF